MKILDDKRRKEIYIKKYKYIERQDETVFFSLKVDYDKSTNHFQSDKYKNLNRKIAILDVECILGNSFWEVDPLYYTNWEKFDNFASPLPNFQHDVGLRLNFNEIDYDYKNLFNGEYHWEERVFDRVSIGLINKIYYFWNYNSQRQAKLDVELISGGSFCEKWVDKVGFDLQFEGNYSLLFNLSGKTLGYDLKAQFESVFISKENPLRTTVENSIFLDIPIFQKFILTPKAKIVNSWYGEANSGQLFITSNDKITYSSSENNLTLLSFALHLRYKF